MRTTPVITALLVLCTTACGVESGARLSAQTAPEAARVEVRRVWQGSGPNFYAAAPSPDGRSMTEIQWNEGDLAVLDFATGELRSITKKGTWSDNVDYAEFSVFSPDGQRIAYTWFRQGAGYEVRIINVDGSGERVLVPHGEDLRYAAVEDWSPDGRQILLTVFRRDRSSQIATASAETGELRVLKTSDWRHPFVAAFSRDSRWIAYDFQPDEENRQRDIFVMRADGSRETRVVAGPSEDVLLGWLPDGSGILFYSDRHQTRGVWKQAIREGRAEGEPQLVKPDVWQLFPLGFSRDAYFYGVDVELPQVHTLTVDQEANRIVVPPAAVQDASAGRTHHGTWSPDGRYFAYLKILHDRSAWLVIRSVAGATPREVRLHLSEPRHPQWDPDGRSILLVGTDAKGRDGVHRVDVRTGETTALVSFDDAPASDLGRYRLAPDGRSLLYWRQVDGSQRGLLREATVVRRDLETGDERALHAFRASGPAFISPDGRSYVKTDFDPDTRRFGLYIASTDGSGERRLIYETAEMFLQNRGGFPFTPDGRHVLAAEIQRQSRHAVLLKIPVDGGPPVRLLEWSGGMDDLRLSPDGRRISFGSGQSLGEVWMMENLGPAPAVGTDRQ